jgi:enoyl-CoA hydratase/carnithine racemase
VSLTELVAVRREGAALILTLTRAERMNALSQQLRDELIGEISAIEADTEVRGVVITGSGRAFSAGADLNEALDCDNVPTTLRYLMGLKEATDRIESLGKPVVAAIEGYCFTGGVELALACDRRIAGEDAQFSVTSSRIGSVAGLGGTQRLPRVIGASAAKDLLMTGRRIAAQEALQLGLVDVVTADPVAAAIQWIGLCAEAAPLSVWLAKVAVNIGTETTLSTALELERLLTALAFTTEDRREGMASVLEHRTARFTGA